MGEKLEETIKFSAAPVNHEKQLTQAATAMRMASLHLLAGGRMAMAEQVDALIELLDETGTNPLH